MTEPVQIIELRTPGLHVEYNAFSGVDIMYDDWVYVHINYNYQYTDNASRRALAEHIVAYLGGECEQTTWKKGDGPQAIAPEQEPVGVLYQHSETGRTRVVMPDEVTDASATWFKVGPLFLHPAHDDTALLRQCLDGYESMTGRKPERIETLIAALRERLEGVK